MIARTVRIWISRGWSGLLYCVSFLVLSLISSCSTRKMVVKDSSEPPVDRIDEGAPADSLVPVDRTDEGLLAYFPDRDSLKVDSVTALDQILKDSIIPGLEIVFNSGALAYGPPIAREMSRFTKRLNTPQPYIKPLVVLDGKIVIVDKERLNAFDFEKDIDSRQKVAALLGVEEKSIVAFIFRKDTDATSVWGYQGINGVLEVAGKKFYRRHKSSTDYQLYK